MKSANYTAQINCTIDSTMHFSRSQRIHITNLEFIGCGGNQVRHVEEFMVKNTKFEGQGSSSTALELIEITAQFVYSTFVSNRKGSYRKYITPIDRLIGGAIIAINSTVDISRSRFEGNRADIGGAIFAEQDSIITSNGSVFVSNSATNGGGGVLYSSSSTITIEESEFYGNNATNRGGILYSDYSNITIASSNFTNNVSPIGAII